MVQRPMRAMAALAILAALFACATAQGGKRIGSLSTLAHAVRGDVFAIDSRTLEVRNFNYDGTGPRAFFWVGKGTPNSDGFAIKVTPGCGSERLPGFSGETVRVELPTGTTINDIDYLSVWCETATQDFGNVKITAASRSGVPAATGAPTCSSTGTFPVRDGFNCEQLNEFYQVRWKISGANIDFELVGAVRPGQYMGFGVSGSETATNMVNSDVVIATEVDEKIQAVDYFLNSRGQCASGGGVCPDVGNSAGNGKNDITKVSGERNKNLLMVRYTRPVAASDAATDRAFKTGPTAKTFVSWATGPYNAMSNVPQIHVGEMSIPTGDVSFAFGRAPANNCRSPLVAMEEKEVVPVDAWTREPISNATDITARIGPSGERRGVVGITGGSSWGIAWYMSPTGTTGEDRLIPAIAVERNKTYTFRVFGGDDATNTAAHHPLYITADKDGGFATKRPNARGTEKIFAGIDITNKGANGDVKDGAFKTPAMGKLCEFKEKTRVEDVNAVKTFADYFKQLDTGCSTSVGRNQAGVLTWKVPGDAPDLLYYQCATHRDLGFKLVVFDEGKVDQTRLNLESGGGPENCNAQFKGETISFKACSTINDEFRVFWNLGSDTIDTLFVATTASGWAGMSWGRSGMVGSNAVMAYRLRDGTEGIDDYFLRDRNSPSPGGNQKLTKPEVEVTGTTIAGRFTRPLTAEGIASLTPTNTDLIWAIGPESTSKTTLLQHGGRGTATVNLASTGAGKSASSGSNTRSVLMAHGIMMGIAWIILIPIGVLTMRFFKAYNPMMFQVHRGLNGLGVLVTLIAFIMAIVKGSHSNKRHLAIGVIVTIIALWQGINGALRPDHEASSRKPWFLLHAYSGRIGLILAAVNVFFGIALFQAPNYWNIIVGVILGVGVLAVILLSLLPSKFPVKASSHGDDEDPAGVDDNSM